MTGLCFPSLLVMGAVSSSFAPRIGHIWKRVEASLGMSTFVGMSTFGRCSQPPEASPSLNASGCKIKRLPASRLEPGSVSMLSQSNSCHFFTLHPFIIFHDDRQLLEGRRSQCSTSSTVSFYSVTPERERSLLTTCWSESTSSSKLFQ